MNLQTRKLSLIKELIGMTGQKVLSWVDIFLKTEIAKVREKEIIPTITLVFDCCYIPVKLSDSIK